MNQLRTSNGNDRKKYCRLKRYWKLLLKKRSELSSVEYKYYSLFGQRTGHSIVDEMLDDDPALKDSELYQELMESMSNKDFAALSSCLTTPVSPFISNYRRTSLKTLRKHLPFIENQLY